MEELRGYVILTQTTKANKSRKNIIFSFPSMQLALMVNVRISHSLSYKRARSIFNVYDVFQNLLGRCCIFFQFDGAVAPFDLNHQKIAINHKGQKVWLAFFYCVERLSHKKWPFFGSPWETRYSKRKIYIQPKHKKKFLGFSQENLRCFLKRLVVSNFWRKGGAINFFVCGGGGAPHLHAYALSSPIIFVLILCSWNHSVVFFANISG